MAQLEVKKGALYVGGECIGIVKSGTFDLAATDARTWFFPLPEITIEFDIINGWRWRRPWIYFTIALLRLRTWMHKKRHSSPDP